MAEQLILAVLYGPLLALGAAQLVAVRRLFSNITVNVFISGLIWSVLILPLLALMGGVSFGAGDEAFILPAARLMRIWLMIFGLAVFCRLSVMALLYAWRRRPRANA